MDTQFTDIEELSEIQDPENVVGFSIFARKDQKLATSDVDLAAFLRLCGVPFCGTLTRRFKSRGREKVKVFLVFPMGEELDAALIEWDDEGVGGSYRRFRYLHRSLMGVINDTKDLENE